LDLSPNSPIAATYIKNIKQAMFYTITNVLLYGNIRRKIGNLSTFSNFFFWKLCASAFSMEGYYRLSFNQGIAP
jgi:hypothetical protein